MPKIYTRGGDDGSTSPRLGERVAKDDPLIELLGSVDEAQAALGLARAESRDDSALDELLTGIERDLWILMAEVATPATRRERLVFGVSAVSAEMVEAIETRIDAIESEHPLEPNFALPGENRRSAALDVARTIVRRAERRYVTQAVEGSFVGPYLNRLSDLCWILARASEGEHRVNRRARTARGKSAPK